MNKYKVLVLAIFLGLQIALLFGEYLNSIYPLHFGEEILLKVEPIDPRSMFRGQYAKLDYTIGTVLTDKSTDISKEQYAELRQGEIVYSQLKKGTYTDPEQGTIFWEVSSVSIKKPENGLFIRGRVTSRNMGSGDKPLTIKYGIEAFFTSPRNALEVEKGTRNQTKIPVAKVMIAPNGKAALADVVFLEKY